MLIKKKHTRKTFLVYYNTSTWAKKTTYENWVTAPTNNCKYVDPG